MLGVAAAPNRRQVVRVRKRAIPLHEITRKRAGAVLCPDKGPALSGDGTVSFTCPGCGAVLAESIRENQVFDVAIECYACRRVSEFPRLPAGAKILGAVVTFPDGNYRLSKAVTVHPTSLLVGASALPPGASSPLQSSPAPRRRRR